MDKIKRIDWIDVAKGVGIFLMVMGHTSMPDAVNRWIYSFHMPLFFLLSGLVFNPGKYPNGGVSFTESQDVAHPVCIFCHCLKFDCSSISNRMASKVYLG